MNKESKVMSNGLTIVRVNRIHNIRYEITDRIGQIFLFCIFINRNTILTNFISNQMIEAGFTNLNYTKAHTGKFKYKLLTKTKPIIEKFIVYPDIMKLAIMSANPSTYTYKEKACEAIIKETEILAKSSDTSTSIHIIKEYLKGIEEDWSLSNDF